jgi:hypothetical protein
MHALLLALPLLATQLVEEIIGTGTQPKPFVEPEGYYAVIIPGGFDCTSRARHVECKGNQGVQALLTIDVVDVPKSATVANVFLNQTERFKKKPHYKLVKKTNTLVDGSPAMTVAFTYDYLKNVEYPVGVQALYMVRGGKTYVVHFESQLQNFQLFAPALAQLYATFKPARLDAAGNPVLEELARPSPNDGTLPEIDQALGAKF